MDQAPQEFRRVSPVARLVANVIDTVFPPQCPSCAAIVDTHGQLCLDCWREIDFIGAPVCTCCGVPLPFEPGEDGLCMVCVASPPAFDGARSVMLYDRFSRKLVLHFKHADRLDPAATYARWMVRAGGRMAREADVVVPVPLHWTRLLRRRYNQSAILAQKVAALLDKPFAPLALERIRKTPSQGPLTRKGRARNVQGAFQVRAYRRHEVEGRRVLLIDDVLTTGATAEACARALRQGGATCTSVLTLARVALPGEQSI